MVMVSLPHNDVPSVTVCIICKAFVPLSQATPGALYANGQQAFACRSHLIDRTAWITGWAMFDLDRNKALEAKRYVEHVDASSAGRMNQEIVRHAVARLRVGSVVIVLHNPTNAVGVFRKHCLGILREMAREQASTLNAQLRKALRESMALLSKGFLVGERHDDATAAVRYRTPDALDRLPNGCNTVYLTTDVPEQRLMEVLGCLGEPGLVVSYAFPRLGGKRPWSQQPQDAEVNKYLRSS